MSAQRAYQYDEEYWQVAAPDEKAVEKINTPPRHRPLVRTALATQLRQRVKFLCILLVIMGSLVSLGSCLCASEGYALVALQTKARNLQRENEQLRINNVILKNPKRIEQIAEDKLGMKMPKKAYFSSKKSADSVKTR